MMTNDRRRLFGRSLFRAKDVLALFVVMFVELAVGSVTMASTQQVVLQHGGRERSCLVYIPSTLRRAIDLKESAGNVPLVMVLHGGRSSAERVKSPRRSIFRFTFDHLAERHEFIAVYPQGIGTNWNDGRANATNESLRSNVDDVGFLTSLVGHLADRYPIDVGRVYVTGASNGGTMALRLAEETTTTWAAVAAVIASVPENRFETYSPRGRVPILVMNGTKDPLIRWDGQATRMTRQELGGVAPTPELIEFWVRHNGADPSPRVERLPDRNRDDGCYAVREWYSEQGPGTAPVVLYRIENGGHTCPNPEIAFRPFRMRRMGNVCQDFEASTVVWEFFRGQQRTSATQAPNATE